jgi:SAM-dependent methyltransferase
VVYAAAAISSATLEANRLQLTPWEHRAALRRRNRMTMNATLIAVLDVPIDPPAAFAALTDDLPAALARHGLHLTPGPGAVLTEGATEVARVVAWEPPSLVALDWRAAPWQTDEVSRLEIRCEAVEGGTRITIEHRGWGGAIGDAGELAGWFAGEVAAPLLAATAPGRFGDWLTDRGARRPSGARARQTYGDPLYHYPYFRAILDELAPGPDDVLLEVGCGGGVFLEWALARGCRAGAVDHSPEMVRLASERNRRAIDEGRLEILHASADRLPFPDDTFTCATMTGVFGFLPDPVAALAEICRVLRPGGRLFLPGCDPEDRGTMAAPEPFASRLRFYDDDALARVGREAGFAEVRVERRSLLRHARSRACRRSTWVPFAGEDPLSAGAKGSGTRRQRHWQVLLKHPPPGHHELSLQKAPWGQLQSCGQPKGSSPLSQVPSASQGGQVPPDWQPV